MESPAQMVDTVKNVNVEDPFQCEVLRGLTRLQLSEVSVNKGYISVRSVTTNEEQSKTPLPPSQHDTYIFCCCCTWCFAKKRFPPFPSIGQTHALASGIWDFFLSSSTFTDNSIPDFHFSTRLLLLCLYPLITCLNDCQRDRVCSYKLNKQMQICFLSVQMNDD